MALKSAEIGPEGGEILLAFTELNIRKDFLSKRTRITIARCGLTEKESTLWLFLPEGLKNIRDLTSSFNGKDIYPEGAAWG